MYQDGSNIVAKTLNEFLVALVSIFAETVTVKFGEKRFTVAEMRQVQMKKGFKSVTAGFQGL